MIMVSADHLGLTEGTYKRGGDISPRSDRLANFINS
jgi:hypothetical protein